MKINLEIKNKITVIFLILFVVWTTLLVVLSVYYSRSIHASIIEMALIDARTQFEKDQSLRSWAASHGGVYVEEDENTPPSPYLSHIPERDITTPSDRKLTLMNPAYMIRQISETHADMYGVKGHITSLRPIRPENAPDEWEKRALIAFERGETEVMEIVEKDGESFLRLMSPMTTRKGCLKCHASQGYKEGDIRGGVSITLPMAEYYMHEREHRKKNILSYLLIWIAGIFTLAFSLWKIYKYMRLRVESENIIAAITESALDAIVMLDKDENISYWNRAAEKVFGYSKREAVDKNALKLLVANSCYDDMVDAFEESSSTGKGRYIGKTTEFVWVRKGGEEFPVAVSFSAVKVKASWNIIAIIRDISRHKEAEEALRESKERLAKAQEIAHLGSWEWNLLTNDLRWSDETYRLLGYTPQEFEPVYDNFIGMLHPDDVEKTLRRVEEAAGGEGEYNLEHRIVHKSGEVRNVHSQGMVYRDENGAPVRMIGTMLDITAQKHAEDKIKTSERKYKSLLESVKSEYFFYSHGTDGVFTFLSPSVTDILGYSEDEFKTHYSKYLTDNPVNEKVKEYSELSMKGIQQPPYQIEIYHKDGTIHLLEVLESPTFDEKGNVIAVEGAAHDITMQKQAEEEKKNLWHQLLQSQKLESIGRLTGGISHDFNNILTGILGYSELAIREIGKDHPLYRRLRIIIENCERAAKLIRQLLAFSRKQVLEIRLNNLNIIVESMVKMLTRVIGEDIKLDLKIGEEINNIRVDETQIEQVLMNLSVNARDAMPTGGTLTIRTEDVYLDEEYAKTHQEVTPGAYVMLSIEDTGIGMTKDVQENIFEPFYTTKGKGEGTGLGLATVFGIIKQHNGSVSVNSEPGKGTIFRIYLPVAKGTMQELKKDDISEVIGGDETILIVDDDDVVRSMVKEVLESFDYRVMVAKNGEEAILVSNDFKEDIDLLVTDVVMTGMNGWQAAKEIKKKRPDMRLIFMSGYMDNPIVIHDISEHNMPFINKPFIPQTLAKKIRDVLDKKHDESEPGFSIVSG